MDTILVVVEQREGKLNRVSWETITAGQTIAAQTSRLESLEKEAQEIEKNLKLVADPETTAALDFRNQLVSTQLLLEIETGDATYRLSRLQDFLSRNY